MQQSHSNLRTYSKTISHMQHACSAHLMVAFCMHATRMQCAIYTLAVIVCSTHANCMQCSHNACILRTKYVQLNMCAFCSHFAHICACAQILSCFLLFACVHYMVKMQARCMQNVGKTSAKMCAICMQHFC